MDKIIEFNKDNHNDNKVNDSNNLKDKCLRFINKKNLKILLLLLVSVVALIIFFGIDTGKKENTSEKSLNNSSYLSTLGYCAELERKLEAVISSIDGAGQVSVMISVEGSPELVYATDTDEKVSTSSSGTTTSSNSSSPIIVNVNGGSNALILTENLPDVKGVIVVSSGAGNVAVKLNILNAVSTLLDISSDQISVLKGI